MKVFDSFSAYHSFSKYAVAKTPRYQISRGVIPCAL